MLSAIASLISPFGGWIVAALGIIAAFLGAYFKGRSSGTQAAQQAQTQGRLNAIEAKRESDNALDKATPSDVDKQLDKWMRP